MLPLIQSKSETQASSFKCNIKKSFKSIKPVMKINNSDSWPMKKTDRFDDIQYLNVIVCLNESISVDLQL